MIFPTLSRAVPLQATRVFIRSFTQAPIAYSSRASYASKQNGKKAPVKTSIDDLHPLPDSIRESITNSSEPKEPYTPTGNSNAPEVHSSRPADVGPSAPDVDPKVAAPNQVNRGNGNGNSTSEEWGTSFSGLGENSFSKETVDVLNAPINEGDIEIKPGQAAEQGELARKEGSWKC